MLVNAYKVYSYIQSNNFEKKNLNYLGHSADVYVHKRMNNNKGNQ